MNKYICILLISMLPGLVMANERDPFAPYIDTSVATTSEKKAPVQRTYSSNTVELDKHPLKSYKLVGVVDSNRKTLAVVRSVENRDYFVSEGEVIGSEGGVIEHISIESMGVVVDEKLVSIPVSNKIIEVDPNAKKAK